MYAAIPNFDETLHTQNEGNHPPRHIIVGHPTEALLSESDHISSTKSHSGSSWKSSLLVLSGVIGGIFLSVSAAGVYKVISQDASDFECIPKSFSLPTISPSPPNHITSDLGVFDAAPNIINSTNNAELYLNKSINARNLFDRILEHGSPVPVSLYLGYNSGEDQGTIQWNDRILAETKNQQFNATSGSCGTHSPALVLAHETEHAEWERSNPLGQLILRSLDGYPFYDNLEEARTIRKTNRIAADLNESMRSTHHGRYNALAKNVSDSNGGICPGGELDSEQFHIQSIFGGGHTSEYKQLSADSTVSATIWETLRPHAASIPDHLTTQLQNLLNERNHIFMRLNAAVSNGNFSAVNFKDILEEHIDKAIDVATQFHGIGREFSKEGTRLPYLR